MFIRKPRSEKSILSILDMCNKEHILHEMKIIKNFFLVHIPDTELIVKTIKLENSYYFYVFTVDHGCICYCEFLDLSVAKDLYKLNKYKYIYEPHSEAHPDFRRFGIVSNIYTYFLLNVPGAVLMTPKHTKLATYLWQSVCKKVKGKIIYHNIVNGKEEYVASNSNIKLLIR